MSRPCFSLRLHLRLGSFWSRQLLREAGHHQRESEQRTQRHQDGGDQRIDSTGEAEADGGDVVEQREEKGSTDGDTVASGQIEQWLDEGQMGAEEVEIGLLFEKAAASHGAAAAQGFVEGEAIVGSISDKKRSIRSILTQPVCFGGWAHGGGAGIGRQVELVEDVLNLGGLISTQNMDGEAALA